MTTVTPVLLDGALNAVEDLIVLVVYAVAALFAWAMAALFVIVARVRPSENLAFAVFGAVVAAGNLWVGVDLLGRASRESFTPGFSVWGQGVPGALSLGASAAVVLSVVGIVRRRRRAGPRPLKCEACGQRALQRIGATPGEGGGGMFGLQGSEWRCERCGHVSWRKG